ncbi:hypothetical protein [Arsenicicoccus dermatophilus]|uniref:hypothetical protein n=1 Tax=Arsenicicoccus dermatophilus TaxID=1076331 RepID=UPI00391729CD
MEENRMRCFGRVTRALTMFCGLQLMVAAFWGFGLHGIQVGSVGALLLGGFLLTLPIVEYGRRHTEAAAAQR